MASLLGEADLFLDVVVGLTEGVVEIDEDSGGIRWLAMSSASGCLGVCDLDLRRLAIFSFGGSDEVCGAVEERAQI